MTHAHFFIFQKMLILSSYTNPVFPDTMAVVGGPKLGLYDIRNLSSPIFSSVSNLKSLSSVNLTSSKVITSGLDGMVKVYKYSCLESNSDSKKEKISEDKFFELAYQMKEEEGISKFAVDPFCMNYCKLFLNGKIELYQKSFYKDKKVREKVLEQQGLENIDLIIESAEKSQMKDPVLASIAGVKYSEKMLARKLGRGLRNFDRGSYKYYNRGLYSKYDENEHEKTQFIKQEKVVNLAKYDKLLRKFKFKEALVKVLQGGNSQQILGVLEQLMIQDDLDTALAQFGNDEECVLMLKFLVKKINSENCQGIVLYLSERFVEILQERKSVSEHVFGWVQRLNQKIEEELSKEEDINHIKSLLL